MAKYLVTFNDQINDIEINGFKIMTDKEVEMFEELATSITWDFTYPLNGGNNLEFSSGEDLLTRLEYKEISNDEYKVISKTFEEKFGSFITIEDLEGIINEEDEHDFIDDEFEDEDEDENEEY